MNPTEQHIQCVTVEMHYGITENVQLLNYQSCCYSYFLDFCYNTVFVIIKLLAQ